VGKRPAKPRQRATVLLDENVDAAAVLKRLRAAGFKVEQSMESIGVVTGTVPDGKMASIRKITGVKSVELEQDYQLAPPDSPVQ
jgi:hypothetical protein